MVGAWVCRWRRCWRSGVVDFERALHEGVGVFKVGGGVRVTRVGRRVEWMRLACEVGGLPGDKEVQEVLVALASAQHVSAIGQLNVGAAWPEHNGTFLVQQCVDGQER